MSKPKVGIVVLNWNRLGLTKQCLGAVSKQTYKNSKVIVIDNGSRDGSVEWLSSQDVLLIENARNRGFAKALNQGIQKAIDTGCQYVVSLNNDASPNNDWLKKLVDYMENHREVGFAQGASMQANDPDKYDSTGIYLEKGFIPNQRAINSTDPRLDVTSIGPNAAGAIYRTKMLKDVRIKKGEFFDGRFFAYVEDVDFDLRCTLRGYKFAFVPKARLLHKGSATGSSIAHRKMFWGARNMVWLVYKNVPSQVFRQTAKIIAKSHLANLQFLWREQRGNFLPYLLGLLAGVVGAPLFLFRRHANLKAQTLSNKEFLNLLTPSNPPLSNPFKRLSNLLK